MSRDEPSTGCSEMVERVARALCRLSQLASGNDPDDLTDHITDRRWHLFVPQARAAIEALREPTEAMVATWYAFYEGGPDDAAVAAREAHRAMIDAALQDKAGG